MQTLTIENISDDLVDRLRKQAELHSRSMQNEVIAILDQSLRTGRKLSLGEFESGSMSLISKRVTTRRAGFVN